MKQKNKITSLQEFSDWIDSSELCRVSEHKENYFRIEAPNNADVFVSIEEDDTIEDIILRTIECLRSFDADERFTELWSKEFAEHNGFTPLHFIQMLKEDEEKFRYLARESENYIKSLPYSKCM